MDRTRIRLLGLVVPVFAVAGVLSGCGVLGLDSGVTAAAGDDVFTLEVGHCLDDADASGEVTTVPIVDCAEPHDSEVFARSEAAGEEFPGADALDAELVAFCQGEAFTDFIGVAYLDSVYVTGGYYPTAASWARGDRELLCTVRADGRPTTGSLEGAAE